MIWVVSLGSDVVGMIIIDANRRGSASTFNGTEYSTCLLWGFSIQKGIAEEGGGICGGCRYDPRYQLYRQVYPTLIPLLRRL